MQQYYIDKELDTNLKIEGDRYKYLVKVVKININENIILFNGKAKAIYNITSIDKKSLSLKKEENIKLKSKNYKISLGIGLLKKDKLEWIIQKATELDIDTINLLKLKNNVVKINSKKDQKIERYNNIVISAVEQSKRDSIPKIKYIDNIWEHNYQFYDTILLAHEKIENMNIVKNLEKLKLNANILILIGPEGGFTNQEIEFFQELENVKLISLGKNILRAETAAISTIGMVKCYLEEKNENSRI